MASWKEEGGTQKNRDHFVNLGDLDNCSLRATHFRGLLAKSKYFCAVYNYFQKELILVKRTLYDARSPNPWQRENC